VVPITVSVVDLDTGELLLFGEGGEDAPLVDVLCASCALPVYFPAGKLAGRRCGDGGLRGPLPLDVAARLARETVVAVDVGPGFDAVGALMASATAAQLALWRADAGRPPLVYVRPRVERSATFRVDRVRR
jgi:NTE family protein